MDKDLVIIKAVIDADYQRHLKRFETLNSIGDVLFLGDSMMAYFPFKQLDLTHVVNQGIPGDTTDGVLNRLNYVYKVNPKRVFLHIGSNDLALTENTEDEIIHHIQMIINNLFNHQIEVYVLSITPVLTNHTKVNQTYVKKRSNDLINRLNDRIKNLKNITLFIDINSLLKDEDDVLSASLTTDGVHLNTQGYHIMYDAMKPYLTI